MSPRLPTWVLLAPALLVLGGLFGGGLAVAVLRSLGLSPALGQTEPSLAAWAAVLGSADAGAGLALSLHIAGTSTLLTALVAVGAALLLRQSFAGRGLAMVVFQLNLAVPHLVAALGLLYLLGQSGSLARLAHALALIDRPAGFPALVHDPAAIAVILHFVGKEVPFVTLVLLAQMQALGADWESVGRTLGASRLQAFRHVLLPLILPGLVRASAVVFAFAFGAFEIPALLGASHPQALPVLVWRSFTDVDLAARAEAYALALVVTAVAGGIVALALSAFRGPV
jgi:putative spermidine/putrescine transport system permease protein